MSDRPTLAEVAKHVPLGFECRSCGGAVYNHLIRAHAYVERGEMCCADMKFWVNSAAIARAEGQKQETKT